MDGHLIGLSQLTEVETERLAAIHHSVMHTLLSDLGLPIVLRYYQIARGDPNVIGLCARPASGEIVGWAIGSPYPDRINTQLRSPLSWFLLQMFRVIVTRPAVFWQLIASVFSAPSDASLKPGAIELTYIGVARDQWGKGWGKTLLNGFIEASRSKGYHSVVLSVEKENLTAISLYEKQGFKVIKTLSEGRYQRHRMELMLT